MRAVLISCSSQNLLSLRGLGLRWRPRMPAWSVRRCGSWSSRGNVLHLLDGCEGVDMAATYEIATAYVSLVPSCRGAGRHSPPGLASNENRRAAGAAGSTLGTAAAAGAGRAIGSRAGSSAIAQGLSGAARASSGAAAAAGATIGQTVASGAGQALGGAAGSRSIGRGFGGAVRGAAGAIGSAAASAGSTFASGMGSAIGRGASTVGRGFRAVGNHLSAQAAAGGALAGAGFSNGFLRAMAPLAAIAGIGSFISAGFNRAANIEDAQKKLEALG